MNYSAIVLAAGSGTRMNLGYNKMLVKLNDIPLILLSLKPFLTDENCKQILVTANDADIPEMTRLLAGLNCEIVPGGKERQDSVSHALQRVKEELVLVHDGARPFISSRLIRELRDAAVLYGCAIPAVKVKDTVKYVIDGFVQNTLPREVLYAVQTPQACQTGLLKAAHEKARAENYLGTDEAVLIEKFTESQVKIVESTYENIKITTREDLILAGELYKKYFQEGL